MKAKITIIIVAILLSLGSQAQAFDKDTKLYNLNLAWGGMVHVPFGSTNPYNTDIFGKPINRAIPTAQLSFQAEFAVHKYIGVGFIVGVGANPSALFREVNIPIAAFANFHFYQYLADKRAKSEKKGKNLHADKLDIYAGLTVGSGLAIHPYGANSLFYQNTFYDALLVIGPHIGVNYYFKKNVAFNGQVGYGVTIVQAGFTFKLATRGK